MNIALDRYLITKKSRPLLVAELSCNHCGSLILAKKIIKEAKMQGADLIKFQTYEPETMTLKSEKSVFKIIVKYYLLNFDKYKESKCKNDSKFKKGLNKMVKVLE